MTPHSVLLIDDNKDFLEILKGRLADTDLQVDCASTIKEARTFFSKEYRVVAADFYLTGGVTGADVLRMYKVKFPYVHAILYTRGTIEEGINKCEVDKFFENMKITELSDLIESIKLFCINDIEPQIIESIFSEINKIKSDLSDCSHD